MIGLRGLIALLIVVSPVQGANRHTGPRSRSTDQDRNAADLRGNLRRRVRPALTMVGVTPLSCRLVVIMAFYAASLAGKRTAAKIGGKDWRRTQCGWEIPGCPRLK
jgi:hypothetical protein